MNSDSDKPVDRRRFFRLGLSELLRPLATAAKPLYDSLDDGQKLRFGVLIRSTAGHNHHWGHGGEN